MPGPDEPQDTSDPVDPQQVSADDELVQRVADGQPPPTGSPEGDTLAHWKATVEEGLPPRYSDPATAFLPAAAGDPRFNDPAHNPIAFLPGDESGRVAYGGEVDYGPATAAAQPAFAKDDGSTYVRVDPDAFDSFDEVDSRSIVDDGAPE